MKVDSGKPYPLGPTAAREGVNFALYASQGSSAALLLFNLEREHIQTVVLDPKTNRTGLVWHLLIADLPESFLYAWSIDGADPLLDPFAKEVYSGDRFGERSYEKGRLYLPLGLVRQRSTFDWQGVRSPRHALKDLSIYEMHVRGFTKQTESSVAGSYLGIIEKIPYLLSLGINAVELLPIFEFNECEGMHSLLSTKEKLVNYWGYSPVSFFAPMNRFATDERPGSAADELKEAIRELHRNGIEVLLDVVYNHTAEGDELGPTYSFKGFAKESYYLIDPSGRYLDFSGCGNSLNCNNPITTQLIITSLRHWVSEYQIDGFRFDLASAMTRGEKGKALSKPPLIEAINCDPILKETKLIAEPWDPGGLYHVGSFPLHESVWAEWNGQYRDTIRRFIRGDAGTKGTFATRLSGSEDLYQTERTAAHSINFVTCHDGFSLKDLVSYNRKHNLDNGENNRDGSNNNYSANYGIEGDTEDTQILSLRLKQEKNFLVALLLSLGVPMVRMGDELLHTQKGNNNCYCQDNTLSWLDWSKVEGNPFFRFFTLLVQLRNEETFLKRGSFLKSGEVEWYGGEREQPLWIEDDGIVAYLLKEPGLYIAFNASNKNRFFLLPRLNEGKCWRRIVDTAKESPEDILVKGERPLIPGYSIQVDAHSALILKREAV